MGGDDAARWEHRAAYLGGGERSAATIAALAREGWELTHITTPHYGALALIGHFRRPAPERPGTGASDVPIASPARRR